MNHKTGFLFHELYMWHDTGSAALWYPAGLRVQPAQHAESKRRLRNLMEVAGILDDLTPVRPRAAIREELSGIKTEIDDPFANFVDAAGGHRLHPHQDEVIARAAALAERVPAG